jgi:hypothetical protein
MNVFPETTDVTIVGSGSDWSMAWALQCLHGTRPSLPNFTGEQQWLRRARKRRRSRGGWGVKEQGTGK